jgi:hypothetical protein
MLVTSNPGRMKCRCVLVEHILLPSTPELLSVPQFSQMRHVYVKDNGTTVGQYITSLRFEKAFIYLRAS